MANYTPIVKLLKPLETDKYDVNLRNENWQKIDDFFGKLQDNLKKHKEALVLDHPDGSVTTPKLRDKAVTTAKLADDINQMLDDSFVKRAGDTMKGNLTFESGKKVFFNTVNNVTAASMYINVHGNLDIGVNDSVDGAVPLISLCSTNKPQWYNKTVGAKPLATYEELLNEVKKYLPLAGGTLTGNLRFSNNSMIIIDRKAGGGFHSISDGGGVSGGQTNLDLGNKDYTTEANLCCYNRPGWYGKDKTNTFKPFLFDDDMVITSGTINDGQTLPVPAGFNEDECHYLLSPNTINTTDPKENSIGSANIRIIKCYHTNRRVVCGVNLTVDYRSHYDGGDGANPNKRYTNWIPGTANYVCIARRKV
jgi:hypothetical protein